MPSKMSQEFEDNDNLSDDSDLCSVLSLEDSEEAEETISSEGIGAEIPKTLVCPSVMWTGLKRKIPVLLFKADAIVNNNAEQKAAGENYRLAFKMLKTECKLVRSILTAHGFHEAQQNSLDFNFMWTGSQIKPYILRSLFEHQKVNHFPRSYEVTRKDRLYKNIQRMQQTKGFKHFDFVPQTFVVPSEYQDFCVAAYKEKGVWIVKPAASSRGRGIYLVTSPDQVSVDENVVICRYITNPFLINGFKFDVRLYVAVTSFDPLLIYIYEEGLTRFATVKFNKNPKSLHNSCMHLTNYSVNKRSSDYVPNDDADVEDFGNKWSLGALLRYLRAQGIDTTALMMSVEDVIIKTLISVELPIASACKMFQPYRGNCFELFGFDILLDENMRPWVLEVNLSPSLACDAPLDLKIKSNMISDLFSLIGLECHDPMTRKTMGEGFSNERRPHIRAQSAKHHPKIALLMRRKRPDSAVHAVKRSKQPSRNSNMNSNNLILTSEELRVIRRTKEEYSRRGGWVRIFPTPDTWGTYSSYLQYSTTFNILLHENLFSNGLQSTADHKVFSAATKQRIVHLHSIPNSQMANGLQNNFVLVRAMQRSKQYERKLVCLGQNLKQRKHSLKCFAKTAKSSNTTEKKAMLVQGTPQDGFLTSCAVEKHDENIVMVSDVMHKAAKMPSEKEPAINVAKMLKAGMTMSKCQARFAFSTYLACIKERLLDETMGQQDININMANEQMDLVLRFLQRAANNLQQPFKLVIPSSKLPINTRKQILAKQLNDFISIYDKETEALKQRTEFVNADSKSLIVGDGSHVLNNELFHKFVINATEHELEEVLTIFTKISKSASIFLRSYSKSFSEKSPCTNGSTGCKKAESCLHKDTALENSKNSISPQKSCGQETAGKSKDCGITPQGADVQTGGDCVSIPPLPANLGARLMPNMMSSYASAVTVYSSKIGNFYPNLKHRPISAVNQKPAGNSASQKFRPLSAVNHAASGNWSYPTTEIALKQNLSSNETIANTLQKLSVKQKLRHCCASTSTLALVTEPSKDSAPGQSVVIEKTSRKNGLYHKVRHLNSENLRTMEGTDQSEKIKCTTSKSDPNLIPPGCIEGIPLHNQPFCNSLTSWDSSTCFQIQQNMIEQSRALLEESKAKHHALIAQAHSIQKQLVHDQLCHEAKDKNNPVPQFEPKPPTKPHGTDHNIPSSRSHRLIKMLSLDES